MTHTVFTNPRTGLFGLAVAAFALLTAGPAAHATDYGLLGLYKVDDAAVFETALRAFEQDIADRGCALSREGMIVGEDGDIDIDTPSRFLWLTCAAPLLRGADTRAVFAKLEAGAHRLALLEGEVFAGENGASRVAGRAYILKVSHYNNDDPDARDADLAALQATVATRADRYKLEAFIAVSHAVGMTTPDEAVLIYYDDPQQGERFRGGNGDIMKAIGGFNKDHLTDFIYYFGAVRPDQE